MHSIPRNWLILPHGTEDYQCHTPPSCEGCTAVNWCSSAPCPANCKASDRRSEPALAMICPSVIFVYDIYIYTYIYICYMILCIYIYVCICIYVWFTLWSFNIAMENGTFIDGLPIKNGDFPWLCKITRGYLIHQTLSNLIWCHMLFLAQLLWRAHNHSGDWTGPWNLLLGAFWQLLCGLWSGMSSYLQERGVRVQKNRPKSWTGALPIPALWSWSKVEKTELVTNMSW